MSGCFSCIPAVVRQTIAADCACECIHFCSFGETPTSISTALFAENSAANPVTPAGVKNADDDASKWKLLYDVMKVERQKVLFEDAHLERITGSYLTVAAQPMSAEQMAFVKDCLHRYVAAVTNSSSPPQNLKYMSWLPAHGSIDEGKEASSSPFAFVLFFVKSFFPPAEWYTTGTTMALLFNAHRENPSAKVVQATLRARATELQKRANVFETLLVHDAKDNYLIPEGSRSNYFLVARDGALLCSAEEDILVGITLRAARRAAERAGLGPVRHEKLTLREVCEATSLVMLGTSPGTLPVREVLLYEDQASKGLFDAAAKHCGVDVTKLDKFKVISENPPRAALEFEVHNHLVDGLMKAYQEESMA